MAGLVDRYANLAQAIGTDAGAARAIPIATALDDIREGYAILFRQPPVTIAVDCPDDLEFPVPRHDFDAAVGNLTANAHRFAQSRIALAARLDDGALVVTVDDDGPGIPGRPAPPGGWGERLDEAPPGNGIGLAIVSDLIDRRSLRLDAAPLGGLRAIVCDASDPDRPAHTAPARWSGSPPACAWTIFVHEPATRWAHHVDIGTDGDIVARSDFQMRFDLFMR